jgi:hypothetical protein
LLNWLAEATTMTKQPTTLSNAIPSFHRQVCFRCFFFLGAPSLQTEGGCCPRCNFPLIVTSGPLDMTQDQIEGLFDRLRKAQARTARIRRFDRTPTPATSVGRRPSYKTAAAR